MKRIDALNRLIEFLDFKNRQTNTVESIENYADSLLRFIECELEMIPPSKKLSFDEYNLIVNSIKDNMHYREFHRWEDI